MSGPERASHGWLVGRQAREAGRSFIKDRIAQGTSYMPPAVWGKVINCPLAKRKLKPTEIYALQQAVVRAFRACDTLAGVGTDRKGIVTATFGNAVPVAGLVASREPLQCAFELVAARFEISQKKVEGRIVGLPLSINSHLVERFCERTGLTPDLFFNDELMWLAALASLMVVATEGDRAFYAAPLHGGLVLGELCYIATGLKRGDEAAADPESWPGDASAWGGLVCNWTRVCSASRTPLGMSWSPHPLAVRNPDRSRECPSCVPAFYAKTWLPKEKLVPWQEGYRQRLLRLAMFNAAAIERQYASLFVGGEKGSAGSLRSEEPDLYALLTGAVADYQEKYKRWRVSERHIIPKTRLEDVPESKGSCNI